MTLCGKFSDQKFMERQAEGWTLGKSAALGWEERQARGRGEEFWRGWWLEVSQEWWLARSHRSRGRMLRKDPELGQLGYPSRPACRSFRRGSR